MTNTGHKAACRSYRIINLIFAALIGMIFLYAGVFSAGGRHHPIPSFYELVTGETSPSSGLSRSFSETVRLNFKAAEAYHPHGIRLFSFFFVQFFLRILFTLLEATGRWKAGYLVAIDVLISAALFIYCFWPFLPVWKLV